MKVVKSIFSIFLLMIVILNVSGCTKQVSEKLDDSKNEAVLEESQTIPNYVKEYEKMIYEFWDSKKNLQELGELEGEDSYFINFVTDYKVKKDVLILDINKDGIEELILYDDYRDFSYSPDTRDMHRFPGNIIFFSVYSYDGKNVNLSHYDTFLNSEFTGVPKYSTFYLLTDENLNERKVIYKYSHFDDAFYTIYLLNYLDNHYKMTEIFNDDTNYTISEPDLRVNGSKVSSEGYDFEYNKFYTNQKEEFLPREGLTLETIIKDLYKNYGDYKSLTSVPANSSYPSGEYYQGTEINLFCDTGIIYYTLDGTNPDENSVKYTGPIVLDQDSKLKAIVLSDNGIKSVVREWNYKVKEIEYIKEIVDQNMIDKGSIFLSNFAEQNMGSFKITEMNNQEKIKFSLNHLYLNSIYSNIYKSRYTIENNYINNVLKQKYVVNSSQVDYISNKYLSSNISEHKSVFSGINAQYNSQNGNYYIDVMNEDGSYSFIKVNKMLLRNDGLYYFEGDEYKGYKSFFTANLIRKPIDELKTMFNDFKKLGKVEALAKLDGNDFKIIEYRYINRDPVLLSTNNLSNNYRIVDAVDGIGVSGLDVLVREGKDNSTSSPLYSTKTTNNGDYTINNLRPGYYTLEIKGNNYIPLYYTFYFDGNYMEGNSNFSVSKTLGDNEVRIVLTWGEHPRDLDSHLVGPNNAYHIYYANKSYDGRSVFLDIDDTSSYGPETITIRNLNSGNYKYFVHDYTNAHSNTSNWLSNSGATVTVYKGNRILGSYTIDKGIPSTIWEVFEIKNGELFILNNYKYVQDFYTHN